VFVLFPGLSLWYRCPCALRCRSFALALQSQHFELAQDSRGSLGGHGSILGHPLLRHENPHTNGGAQLQFRRMSCPAQQRSVSMHIEMQD
jgi:hypothetical protein